MERLYKGSRKGTFNFHQMSNLKLTIQTAAFTSFLIFNFHLVRYGLCLTHPTDSIPFFLYIFG